MQKGVSDHRGASASHMVLWHCPAEMQCAGAQAKDAAHTAANAAHRSAKATWSALERMTQAYTNSRQYYMLDDLVEATGAAKKVSELPSPSRSISRMVYAICREPAPQRILEQRPCFQQGPARPICPWCVGALQVCSQVRSYGQVSRPGHCTRELKSSLVHCPEEPTSLSAVARLL